MDKALAKNDLIKMKNKMTQRKNAKKKITQAADLAISLVI
jgi:hypothetical protein